MIPAAPLLTLTALSSLPSCTATPPHLLPTCSLLPAPVHPPSSLAHQPELLASASPLPPRSVRLLIRCPFAISIQVPWLTKSSSSPGRRAVETRATSCSSLLEEPQEQLSCCSERHSMPSEIRSIGPTIRRLAKGTIDLVRWRAPVQLLKYATRTVWFKNVNTGYPVADKKIRFILSRGCGLLPYCGWERRARA